MIIASLLQCYSVMFSDIQILFSHVWVNYSNIQF